MRRDGDDQFRALGNRIPVSITDDLVVGFKRLLPVRWKGNFRDRRRASGNDVPIEIEHHQLLEIAESFVERNEVIAKSALCGRGHGAARAAIEGNYDFVGSCKDAQVVEPLSQPDARCACALRTAGEQVFVDFFLEGVAILGIEHAQHCARRKQSCRYRECENSAAQALEAREG